MIIVWFKKDLRIQDHEPLFQALNQSSHILPLYIFEPDLWQQPDLSLRHFSFLKDCLNSLNADLVECGQPLIFKVGDAVEVLSDLINKHGVTQIFSHQETGNMWTFNRDIKVRNWLKTKHVVWKEFQTNGVMKYYTLQFQEFALLSSLLTTLVLVSPFQNQTIPY